MDYAVLFRWKSESTTDQEAAAVMLQEGSIDPTDVEVLAKYTLDADEFAAVWIIRAKDRVALMDIEVEYGDAFEVSVLPAVSAEEFGQGW